ncbi:hypothetical protein SLEP1_g2439 [Rubroshorea leprosula]|uniref:Uncharacterized protein n=1 Tax=Rubroshorea leprosula TaxID=152421 RepID=A0AAV5HQW8_9ROSI|nr:hypothetical protein SLEP1_g2439 [Rubroshorea leprosula]
MPKSSSSPSLLAFSLSSLKSSSSSQQLPPQTSWRPPSAIISNYACLHPPFCMPTRPTPCAPTPSSARAQICTHHPSSARAQICTHHLASSPNQSLADPALITPPVPQSHNPSTPLLAVLCLCLLHATAMQKKKATIPDKIGIIGD